MAVPRRGVVETEQERQWKQLQAHRQQQQQQQLASGGQMVPLGGHVPVPAGSMAMPPGQPDTVIGQQQQQQQILQQQPPMPNQQQQQQQQLGGGFATPIQVSRVRAPGEPINGPTGPVFMLRGPGNAPNVQQQTAVVPPSTMVMAPDGVEGVDPSVVVSGGVIVDPSRQQLRDLLQRQQMQQQQQSTSTTTAALSSIRRMSRWKRMEQLRIQCLRNNNNLPAEASVPLSSASVCY